MPRYFREPEPVVRTGFKTFEELTHFVTKIKPHNWREFQGLAHRCLSGDIVPRRRLKKKSLYKILTSPTGHHLLPELHHELQQHYEEEDIGGGIAEGTFLIAGF